MLRDKNGKAFFDGDRVRRDDGVEFTAHGASPVQGHVKHGGLSTELELVETAEKNLDRAKEAEGSDAPSTLSIVWGNGQVPE